MRRKRRPWTEADDALLRKFHAEKKSDADIGYILTRDREVIRQRRNRLGLKPVSRGGYPKGCKMSPEACKRRGEINRRLWQDPAYREKHLPRVLKQMADMKARAFRAPSRQTPEGKQYRKYIRNLGVERARAEMGL